MDKYMEFIVPGITAFKNMDKPEVEQPVRTEPSYFGGQVDRQTEHEEEAWRLGDYIPSTYLEDGVRKIYVWDLDEPVRYTYTPENGLKQVKEVF